MTHAVDVWDCEFRRWIASAGDKADEVDIPETDLEITTTRSGGAGESDMAMP
jgi:protein subunit release factor B